jgi:uncharacterized protein (DUF4415 family)
MSTVKYTIDPQKPPRMSKAERQRLEAMRDEDIDYSDIPELDAAFWEQARIAAPTTKANVSLRVSDEVLAFFKADNPKGYTARMAAVLSAYVKAHTPK